MLSVAVLAACVVFRSGRLTTIPSGVRRGGGFVDAGGHAVRSPRSTNGTVTAGYKGPTKTVRVFTDFPKLGDVPVNGSAGFDMVKDEKGVWSFTSPKLKPSYYQYWFVMDGLTLPDPMNTFVRPASGVYKSIVAVPGKEAEFTMFRDVPHGTLKNTTISIEKQNRPPPSSTCRQTTARAANYPVLYLLHGAND